MESMLELLLEYRLIIAASVMAVGLYFVIKKNKKALSFWWLNFRYSFPIIGTLARIGRNTSYRASNKMYDSEGVLCSDYYVYYEGLKKSGGDYYDKCRYYLGLLDEIDRKPLPFTMLFLVFSLLVVEALGFSYVFAGYAIPGASENVRQYGSWVLAGVFAFGSYFVTHLAGKELYKNSFMGKIKQWWINDTDPKKGDLKKSEGNTGGLDNPESDMNAPDYVKYLNRIEHGNKIAQSYIFASLAAVVITAIVGYTTYVRGEALEAELAEQVTQEQQVMAVQQESGVDPFSDQALPESLATAQSGVDQEVQDEQIMHQRNGGWGTFVVLGILYVVLQIFGVYVGYAWGFVGQESEKAYEFTKNFLNRQDFENYYERKRDYVVKVAEQKLRVLHQLLRKQKIQEGSAEQLQLDMTFEKYIAMREEKKNPSSQGSGEGSSDAAGI